MSIPTNAEVIEALHSGNALVALRAVSSAVQKSLKPSPIATLSVYDQYYNCIEPDCANRAIELRLKDPRKDLPAGSMMLDGNDWLADKVIQCETLAVPVIFNKGPYRWSGRVDVAHDQMKNGVQSVQCELVGDKTWLDRILCWPNPFFPIFIQEPGEWFGIGPGLTVIATLIMEQAFRLQMRLWELVNDITSLDFNFVGWLTELMYGDGAKPMDLMQALVTPICVVPINPLTDESAWIEINGRMDTIWKLINQQLQDNGFDVDATMWLPGDPQPEGLWFPLTVATCVIRLIDRSGFTGPWGPFEGLVVDLTQLEGSLLGNALQPLLNPTNEAAYLTPDLGEYIAPAIGVDFVPPTVYFNLDVIESGAIEYSIDHHAPQAYQVVIGGKSPEWVCAPHGDLGGTDLRHLNKRSHQRDARVGDRRHHYRVGRHRNSEHHSGRPVRQHPVRLLRGGELQHADKRRSVHVRGEVLPQRGGRADDRHALLRATGAMGCSRIPLGTNQFHRQPALRSRTRNLPRRAGVLHPPRHPLHRLRREHRHQHHTRTRFVGHVADR